MQSDAWHTTEITTNEETDVRGGVAEGLPEKSSDPFQVGSAVDINKGLNTGKLAAVKTKPNKSPCLYLSGGNSENCAGRVHWL